MAQLDPLYRGAFRLCVYTGLRAGFHRLRHCFLRRHAQAARIHGVRLPMRGSSALQVFVHRRPRPSAATSAVAPESTVFGMFSLRQTLAPIRPTLYRYLCLTSHFGCGQLEVAFYGAGEELTIYAVRDVARSNAERLGWRSVASRLGSQQSDVIALRALVDALEHAGLTVRLAQASECVELAMNNRLVQPRASRKTRLALEKKYRRLPRALARNEA